MSCDTLNLQSVALSVAIGKLPEGFCPETMQDLAQAIADRLIVTPGTNFNGFAIGSVAPTANVGPWFKNCAEWFIWDDATATYIPISKGGFNTQQYFTASADFVVPAFIYKLRVHCWGGGGGGFNTAALGASVGGGGGGGGGYVCKIVDVLPQQVIPMTIGLGGITGAPATAGGNTSFLTLAAGGGGGASDASTSDGASGGTAAGGDVNMVGQAGSLGIRGGLAARGGDGGDAGGGGGKGGMSANATASLLTGLSPGGGGAGGIKGVAIGDAGGAGAVGGILIEY